ncbi:2-phospho-L-lactate transferase [Phenylobacterium sp. SCN 70-31]|uniref:2-phospho-L-lactate transferase n=1 Tax=Phenylobacterium sp. SCN 70-31 TaxID=1660129 RepID=UPI00086A86B2|nr:2-phospho-L-lactate transferase [Phenylobacterium sp. SCN 70-31]ODT88305.1 MAG: 2-phospho-L-lactate transferase [Phenylobacterium sp. SCN 70-31]
MSRHVLALCGGVGGAKLAAGLARAIAPGDLSIVVNTGDDFVHLGLHVSPDIDTVAYTLAGLSDRERGWGIAGETWAFMASLRRLGGEDWFQLGDQDLAMHVERTRRLSEGQALSTVTAALTRALGIDHAIIPMSDDPVATIVQTDDGELSFQHYFVRDQCRPVANGIRFEGAAAAKPSPGFEAALARDDLATVILCPSNPYLSIDPILAIPGVRGALEDLDAPIVAISPIIGGRAVKGPTAKLMVEMGLEPGVTAIAEHYRGLLDGLVVDPEDSEAAEALHVATLAIPNLLNSDEDRLRVAQASLAFAEALAQKRRAER